MSKKNRGASRQEIAAATPTMNILPETPNGDNALVTSAEPCHPTPAAPCTASNAEEHNTAWIGLFAAKTKLAQEFAVQLHAENRLGFDSGFFSISVLGRTGQEEGACRLKIDEDEWIWQTDSAFPLVFGDPAKAKYLFVALDLGDLLAVMNWLGWHDGGFGADSAFISTGQDPLLSLTGLGIGPDAAVLVLPTNSRQAADWLAAVGKAFEGREFYQIMAPIGYSGFSAWLQSGATPEDFLGAFKEQKVSPYSVVPDAGLVEWRRREIHDVRDALTFVPADDEVVRRQVGVVLHALQFALGAAAARDLWNDWLQTVPTLDRAAADCEWVNFKSGQSDGAAGRSGARERLAEIYLIAKEYGWKPLVLVPPFGGPHTVFAGKMGELLAETGTVFQHGREPVEVATTATAPVLKPIIPARASTLFERVARLQKLVKGVPTLALWPEKDAKISIHAAEFLRALPEIRVVTNCPVLVERGDGTLAIVQGFDAEAMVYAGGVPVEDVALEEAVKMITGLAADYLFETAGDRARFIAGFITPAFVPGGLLGFGGRPPMEATFGDHSQAGKGHRNKLITATYNTKAVTLNVRKQGVGGLDEGLDAALRKGADFVSLDNVRGELNSQKLESMLTEDLIMLRSAYTPNMVVDPTRTCVLMTSNGANLTQDILNRSSIVRVRKQPLNYPFPKFPEGGLLDHVRANQPKYLGAVFAIVREWHRLGKPELEKAGHDFRPWAKKLGWIVENLLRTAPLMEGHGENQRQLANPNLNWLRCVGLAVLEVGAGEQDLQAARIVEILEQKRPELLETILSDTATSGEGDPGNKRLLAMGRKLAACFTGKDPAIVVETGEIRVTRTERLEPRGDGLGTTLRRLYRFEYAHFGASQAIPTLPPACRVNSPGPVPVDKSSTHQHPSAPIAPMTDKGVSSEQSGSGEGGGGSAPAESVFQSPVPSPSLCGVSSMDATAAMGAMDAGSSLRRLPGPDDAWWLGAPSTAPTVEAATEEA